MDRLETWLKLAAALVGAFWGAFDAFVQALSIAMGIDIITGLMAAYVAKNISSEVSFRGITKKAMILMLVLLAYALQHYVGLQPFVVAGRELSLGSAVALWYIVSESVSVMENMALAKVPLPPFLKEVLAKLSPGQPGA